MTNIREVLINALPEIVKYAPTLASGLINPVGSIASYALSAISAMYGINSTDLHALASSIITDSNRDKTLANLEHEHKDIICSMIDNIPKVQGVEITLKLQFKDNS